MKKLTIFLLVSVWFYSCTGEKETVHFSTLSVTEFNSKPFQLPEGKISDSLKQAHDSCMGFSFDANALLIQRRIDTIFIASIVNKRSLEILNTITDLGISPAQLITKFNIITNPCYENRVLHFPLKLVMGENFSLHFPNVNEAVNKEINDAITASYDVEMQTGSWVYLDMRGSLRNIMDTIKTPEGLRYKNNLLDTSNMVLTTVESVTDVSFIINTNKNMSAALQAFLSNKPYAPQQHPQAFMRFFYLDNNKFQITLNGYFPVVGRFMKAELE